MNQHLFAVINVIIAASIFFVWVVRYENVTREFTQYNLPPWLRDLVGILKLSCATLLLLGIFQKEFTAIAATGLGFLMLCAVATHVRTKNPVSKMVPAMTLLGLCTVLLFFNL